MLQHCVLALSLSKYCVQYYGNDVEIYKHIFVDTSAHLCLIICGQKLLMFLM
jgi:hypothetical protein